METFPCGYPNESNNMAGTPNPDAIVNFAEDPLTSGLSRRRVIAATPANANPEVANGSHVESGIVQFRAGGSGEGYDYVTVTLVRMFPSDGYVISLTTYGGNDPTVALPDANPFMVAMGSFRIYPQAQFNGFCSWRAADPGL